MTDDEFLANFHMDRACRLQLNYLVEDDDAFGNYKGRQNKWLSMLVFLKYLGSYGNEASLVKIGHTMGISKGAVNECDDMAKITWAEMGWPGSMHDNQVWANSHVYLSKEKYFGNKEFLLGDSAFSASSVMVPAFKKEPQCQPQQNEDIFQHKASKDQD